MVVRAGYAPAILGCKPSSILFQQRTINGGTDGTCTRNLLIDSEVNYLLFYSPIKTYPLVTSEIFKRTIETLPAAKCGLRGPMLVGIAPTNFDGNKSLIHLSFCERLIRKVVEMEGLAPPLYLAPNQAPLLLGDTSIKLFWLYLSERRYDSNTVRNPENAQVLLDQ